MSHHDGQIPPRILSVPEPLRTCHGIPDWYEQDFEYAPYIEVRGERGEPHHRGFPGFGQCGASMFCFHRELPVEGNGESFDACLVLERDPDGSIRRTPYREWCRALDLRVLCIRCRRDILDPETKRCDPNVGYRRRILAGEIDISDIETLD